MGRRKAGTSLQLRLQSKAVDHNAHPQNQTRTGVSEVEEFAEAYIRSCYVLYGCMPAGG